MNKTIILTLALILIDKNRKRMSEHSRWKNGK